VTPQGSGWREAGGSLCCSQGDSFSLCRTCGVRIDKSKVGMIGWFPYAGTRAAVNKKSGLGIRSWRTWRKCVNNGDVRDESAGCTAA